MPTKLLPRPWEWLVYAVMTVNILLVIFDYSYLSLRPFYLNNPYVDLNIIPQVYDPIKDIEPYDVNALYLETAQTLSERYHQNPQDSSLPELLASLRNQSANIIKTDPYARARLTGTLERLKDRIRKQMKSDSATNAFAQFWSPQNLSPQSLAFYDQQLKPLLRINYYRHYGEDGEFQDFFWKIDIYFVGFFTFEYLVRALWLSRLLKITFGEALLERWYDALWLLTFSAHGGGWRLIRLIPYTIRSSQLGAPFYWIIDYFNNRYAQVMAQRISDLVVVQLVDELAHTIREIDLKQVRSIGSSAVNQKIEALILRQTHALTHRVLPEIEPEVVRLLVSLLRSNKALAPLLPESALEPLLRRAYRVLVENAQTAAPPDPKDQLLLQQLNQKLIAELTTPQTLGDIQEVAAAFLEDAKQDYLKRHSSG